MSKQNAMAVLQFLDRVELKGGEAIALVNCAQWLQAIARGEIK